MPRRLDLLLLPGCLLLAALLWAACDAGNADDGPDVSVIDLVTGSGEEAVNGARLTVHYIGKLDNGQIFDSSYKQHKPSLEQDTPFTFTLGTGFVIRGWDRGLPGMREGGKRRLIIPPELGYGSRGVCFPDTCVIPPDATLVFDIDLLDVLPPRAGARP